MIEHPLEFEFRDGVFDTGHVSGDRVQRVVVGFALGQFEEFGAVLQASVDLAQIEDDALEQFLLAAEFLRLLLVVPDFGVFEFARDLGQPCCLGIEVKDTSAARPRAPRAKRDCCRSG